MGFLQNPIQSLQNVVNNINMELENEQERWHRKEHHRKVHWEHVKLGEKEPKNSVW